MPFDPREFRNALGTFATGITVVTIMDGDAPIGVTINSFASVSLEPPLILFSLKKDSALIDVFKSKKPFNVNILSNEQMDISNLFAGKSEDKFSQCKWSGGENGAPVFDDVLSVLECDYETEYDGGDHTIFIGRVTSLSLSEGKKPLLYFAGGYAEVAK